MCAFLNESIELQNLHWFLTVGMLKDIPSSISKYLTVSSLALHFFVCVDKLSLLLNNSKQYLHVKFDGDCVNSDGDCVNSDGDCVNSDGDCVNSDGDCVNSDGTDIIFLHGILRSSRKKMAGSV